MEAQIESFTNHLGGWWWAIALLLVMSVFLLKNVVWKRTHSKSGTTGYKKSFRLGFLGFVVLTLLALLGVMALSADNLLAALGGWGPSLLSSMIGAVVFGAGWYYFHANNLAFIPLYFGGWIGIVFFLIAIYNLPFSFWPWN